MADRLTQLQDCYEQLATQFYASIRYVSLHHNASPLPPPAPLPSSSSDTTSGGGPNGSIPHPNTSHTSSLTTTTTTTNTNPSQPSQPSQTSQDASDPSSLPPEQRPDSPNTFAAAQKELAHDLILKTRQIEYLIGVLPGVGAGKASQEERIRALEGELRGVLEERRGVEGERERGVGVVEGVIGGVRR
ncbi:hypothetical protein N7G274_010633 [Stereocaulon virgatum]|uniref:Mediator of RNA polymerase II transcription subunit 21 n=1 Tax=Stereocaulon virgatum TaxID=373712 RepID=A0ABR3ZT48_9LECA